MKRVAVIGAGIAGLVVARDLAATAEVVVFEKSRGYGGRMATRRETPYEFDHGAQFFTARSKEFSDFLQPYIAAGHVARWDAEFVEIDRGREINRRNWAGGPAHYVGVPRMNSLAGQIAETLDVRLQIRVGGLRRKEGGWEPLDEDGRSLGVFDWAVSAIPALQAAALLPAEFAAARTIGQTRMLGCYSLMLGYEQALPLDWQAAFVSGGDISWISNNSSKPGRPPAYTLLVHSTNRWAEAHLDTDAESVIACLGDELGNIIGQDLPEADHVALHRWRYANIGKQRGAEFYVDRELQLAAVGDWCIQGRVEAAFSSARGLTRQLRPIL